MKKPEKYTSIRPVKPVGIPTEQKDFLVNEYSNLNRYVSNAWTIKYSILSGGVIIFGSLLSQAITVETSTVETSKEQKLYALMLPLVPTVLSLILGQLTFATYLFCFRMSKIAQRLKIDDIWNQWFDILGSPKQSQFSSMTYAGSFPFVVVLSIGTIIAPIHIFFSFCDLKNLCSDPFFSILIFASIIIIPINMLLIYVQLMPKNLYKRVKRVTTD